MFSPNGGLVWILAIRLLREGKAQTTLILVGITLGVAVIVFLSALISGLQASIIDKTLGTQAHIVLRPLDDANLPVRALVPRSGITISKEEKRAQRLRSINGWQGLLNALDRENGIRAVSPMASGPGFAIRGNASKSVAILGVDPVRYSGILPLEKRLTEGRLSLAGEDALIGTELARDLGLEVGDKLRLTSASGLTRVFTVSGIFSLGIRDLDRRWVYTGMRPAQTLLGLPGGVTNIDITINNIFEADALAAGLARQHGVTAESWMKTNAQLMTGLRSQGTSSSIIRLFVLISVAFGIASVLAVSVVQKSREIGILRAMGCRQRDILKVFLLQGGILGLAGSLAGTTAGAGLAALFTSLVHGADGQSLFPILITPVLVLTATASATVTGIIAAAVPAWRAAKLDPVAAIRG